MHPQNARARVVLNVLVPVNEWVSVHDPSWLSLALSVMVGPLAAFAVFGIRVASANSTASNLSPPPATVFLES